MLVASILGCILVLFAGVFFVFGLLTLLISAGDSEVKAIPNRAILQITFEKPLFEQSSDNPFSKAVPYGLYKDDGYGYFDMVSAIDRAAFDDRIQMIYLNTNFLTAGISHIGELREALKRFRASGKAIVAYSDSYSQAGYYLASVADKVYLNPHGEIDLRGFAISVRYYKGLMDELGVAAQIIRHGKYKSGGESFTQQQMNAEERTQLTLFLESAWSRWADDISSDRHLNLQIVNKVAEQTGCSNSAEAVELEFIDEAFYKDELIAHLCKLQDVKSEKQLRLVNMQSYMLHKPLARAKEKIAVLYADGTIYHGKGTQNIMSENYIRTIRQLRADSSIKAVVLRINSSGGDARAAAVIHRELKLLNEIKPLIVSMGDNAASGGYWMASAGAHILGTPTTLTGSIGAYAMTWNGQKGMNKWLKVNVETVRTHPSSDMGSIYRPLNSSEMARLQKSIDQTYHDFVSTVSQNRSIPYNETDALAQGRIWSGEDARENGLIDQTGGLYDAIQYAAKSAEITEYQTVEYPSVSTFWERIKHTVSTSVQSRTHPRLRPIGPDPQKWAEEIENTIRKDSERGIQTKVPFIYTLSY